MKIVQILIFQGAKGLIDSSISVLCFLTINFSIDPLTRFISLFFGDFIFLFSLPIYGRFYLCHSFRHFL